jgi:hypothetical protein
VLITGPGVELRLGLGFCAKARKGDSPTAVVAVALRKLRRVALAKDQLPFAGSDAEPLSPQASNK